MYVDKKAFASKYYNEKLHHSPDKLQNEGDNFQSSLIKKNLSLTLRRKRNFFTKWRVVFFRNISERSDCLYWLLSEVAQVKLSELKEIFSKSQIHYSTRKILFSGTVGLFTNESVQNSSQKPSNFEEIPGNETSKIRFAWFDIIFPINCLT